MFDALKRHWPEYLMEGAGLGMFMLSASVLAVVLFHPDSLGRYLIVSPFLRRALMGIGMGLTAIGLIYSCWGNRRLGLNYASPFGDRFRVPLRWR